MRTWSPSNMTLTQALESQAVSQSVPEPPGAVPGLPVAEVSIIEFSSRVVFLGHLAQLDTLADPLRSGPHMPDEPPRGIGLAEQALDLAVPAGPHRLPGTQTYVGPSSSPSVAYRAFWQAAGLGSLAQVGVVAPLAVQVVAGLIPRRPGPVRCMAVGTAHGSS